MEQPIVLSIVTEWSGASHILDTYMKELAVEFDEVKFYRAPARQNEQLFERWPIEVFPYTLILKEGKKIGEMRGLMSKKKIKSKLEAIIHEAA